MSRLAIPEREIPVIDVGPFLAGEPGALEAAAAKLRHAQEKVGFYYLTGHGVPQDLVDAVFEQTRRFHALPLETKLALKQNEHHIGYMPFRGSITAASPVEQGEKKPNLVAAFFVKRDLPPDHPDVLANKRFRGLNQWPPGLPGFRETCVAYCNELERVAKALTTVYAVALDLSADWFREAFSEPQYTLRLSHYPAVEAGDNEYGVAPHTDSGFLTLLAQNEVPGLSIRKDGEWLDAPVIPGAFVVNGGETLRRWTNDRFLATPHRAINASGGDRYAIPFFFDAQIDHVMECLPTCQGPGNPPKYPPTTHMEFMTSFARANYAAVRDAEKAKAPAA